MCVSSLFALVFRCRSLSQSCPQVFGATGKTKPKFSRVGASHRSASRRAGLCYFPGVLDASRRSRYFAPPPWSATAAHTAPGCKWGADNHHTLYQLVCGQGIMLTCREKILLYNCKSLGIICPKVTKIASLIISLKFQESALEYLRCSFKNSSEESRLC